MNCNIVLSGGGTRGYAHIGVLKGLHERGVTISEVSGTSSGAIVGAMYCDGYAPDEIGDILLKHEPEINFNLLHMRDGLFSFEEYERLMNVYLRARKIEDLQIPLHISLTDLNDGSQKIYRSGDLIQTLVASAAVPVLLPPRMIDGVPCADGGLSNNLPVEPFVKSPLKTIGVHVNPLKPYHDDEGFIHRLDRSMHMLMRSQVLCSREQCDIFIEPEELQQFHLFESGKTKELIRAGYDHVMKMELPL